MLGFKEGYPYEHAKRYCGDSRNIAKIALRPKQNIYMQIYLYDDDDDDDGLHR